MAVPAGAEQAAAEVMGPAALGESPAAVLLVDLATRCVVHANALAAQLAPGVVLPALVDEWSDAAELRDPDGEELSETSHPLSLAAQGLPVPGQAVTALRSSDVSERREPLFAVGLPLADAPGLGGHALVVLIPMHDRDAVGHAAHLARSEARVRDRAVLATGISFTVADATAPDQPLVWVNPAFTTVTGYTAEEAVGRNCRFLQTPETDPAAVALLRGAVEGGHEVSLTLLNQRKDGSAFWNQIALSPVRDASGMLTHFVGVQTDVTTRVEAERVREAALAAERRARAEADEARVEAELARAEAEAARAAAERAGARLALVAEGSQVLAATLDPDEALDQLLGLLVPAVADWAVVTLADDRGRLGRPSLTRHRDGHEDLLLRYAELVPAALGAGSRLHRVMQGGTATLVPDLDPPALDGSSVEGGQIQVISASLGERSLVLVPLVARRRVLGTLMLVHGTSGRVFDEEDLAMTADLGRRAGLVLDNTRLYAHQKQTALTLQRGLLPTLPTLPGLHLAARYLPAGHESQVGGDWWDVFALPDGGTALAIGDVMGHDVAAAAAMGQLRSVLRTCAWEGDEPETVLERMDQLVQGFEMAQLATCVYARLTTTDSPPQLRWASAGHLPLVLFPATGPPRLLTAPTGVPLGVPAADRRAQTQVDLSPGDTLLLFTDGLVETRHGDIDGDLERLLTDLADLDPADGPEVLLEGLIARRTDLTDDVAVLAVTLGGAVQVIDPDEDRVVLPAHPASTRAARRHVAGRCRARSLALEVIEAAELITSELVTNAVLHGRSPVTVSVSDDGADLRVEVEDDNARHPRLQPEDEAALGGRGLHIVDTLADHWGVADHRSSKSVWFELTLHPRVP